LLRAEQQARRDAEDANRSKGQFLATMSHELRTPLNAISGHIQLIELGLHGPVSEPQRAALGRVSRAQERLLGLINDILNFARLESGRLEYNIQQVVASEVVADVVALMEPQFTGRGLLLDVRLPSDDASSVLVRADREKLVQVLLNLLSNAEKFTPAGGRVALELVTTGSDFGAVLVRVSDTGVGIPADKLQTIFEPFVQLGRSLTSTRAGTGLGLAISRDLARGMGGDLTVESVPGTGSIFTLSLQRA
jgi:signal transduction histidine kinase